MSKIKEHYHNKIEAGMRAGSQKPEARSQHKIQWLNLPGYKGETWNPIIGCSKVSDGCKNCYAERMANRMAHNPKTNFDYAEVITASKWNGKTTLSHKGLFKPASWRTPRLVFVCSMGDLFHESTSFDAIEAVFSVMADCDRHIFIVLTKRPERMFEFYNWKSSFGIPWIPSKNVWMGVTAENQLQANNRIQYLNCIYAAVKFVSIEPMLSEISLHEALGESLKYHAGGLKNCLSWVICGGESGHNARPVHPDWVLYLRNQCMAAGIPFFFKQWGELLPSCQDTTGEHSAKRIKMFKSPHNPNKMNIYYKVGKHRSGNLLDGEKYEEYPNINL
jgi:protein gp37